MTGTVFDEAKLINSVLKYYLEDGSCHLKVVICFIALLWVMFVSIKLVDRDSLFTHLFGWLFCLLIEFKDLIVYFYSIMILSFGNFIHTDLSMTHTNRIATLFLSHDSLSIFKVTPSKTKQMTSPLFMEIDIQIRRLSIFSK